MNLVSFASDNHSGIPEAIWQAMTAANQGYAPSYGMDPWSEELRDWLKHEFACVDSTLVFNGTAANVLCLQMGLESYQSVLCAETSHLHQDECGAPEKIAGVKLIPIPSQDGKLRPEQLQEHVRRLGDQHFSQVGMVSITQPTEYGTVYSLAELSSLREFCDRHQLLLHLDGARLANAAVTLNCGLGQVAQFADLISLGGAKKGLLLGEMVLVRQARLTRSLKFLRKQSLQLPAKTRFLAAGFLTYLKNDLWRTLASHENSLAQSLRSGLEGRGQIHLTQPTQANSVFATIPKEWVKPLRRQFFFYVWDEKKTEIRLMMSHSTSLAEVNEFLRLSQDLPS